MLRFILTGIVFWSLGARAQTIIVDPAFPSEDDSITVLYNASSGNKALQNVSEAVYAHTGLITSKSTSGTDWKYVQGTWGTADSRVLMKKTGANQYAIRFHLRSFYGLPSGEKALKLAFVFRNQDGSKVGRETDGSDIFYNLSTQKFSVKIQSPSDPFTFAKLGDTVSVSGVCSAPAKMEWYFNGILQDSDSGTSTTQRFAIHSTCVNMVILKAINDTVHVSDTLYIVTPDLNNIGAWPSGAVDGITYLSDTRIRFSLYAPGKSYIYLIGDFNNWAPSCIYQMKRTPDGNRFWLDISGFTPQKEYTFQYLVDGVIRIADPYSRVILDPANDAFIPSGNYPGLKPYPTGKTTGLVTLIKTGQTPFVWKAGNYKRPAKENLVIYELLVRDFVASRSYKTLKDTLGYFKRMGINCIELMPVSEYEGNNSWGYNVSFHGALDKEYGTIEHLKSFIDACHELNIAVVLDVVFNHAFSQSSLCRLYWNDAEFKPAANNPWLNVTERHPFNVGYDFNHESYATQYYMDQILKYWMEEFNIDGFRFDLSKGFTQKYTGADVGAWGAYDQSRINLLKRMGDKLFAIDPGAFLILEHFADNSEEKVLADYGFMLWGNMVHDYNESSMGYSSDLSWGIHKSRNWNQPRLVSYLESHDEERLMVKNLLYGNGSGSYSVKNLPTALSRMEQAGCFFFTLPGPKMFWQFAELGYDVSINTNGRTGTKPIRWNYLSIAERKHLLDVWSSLIQLKTTQPIFQTDSFSASLNGFGKTIYLNSANQKVAVVGNFNVTPMDVQVNFQQTGVWYEFFSGDSLLVSKLPHTLTLVPGAYRLYTTSKINGIKRPVSIWERNPAALNLYPNPASNQLNVDLGPQFEADAHLIITDLAGKMVLKSALPARVSSVNIASLCEGSYLVQARSKGKVICSRLIIRR